jgi:probable HAF family extracellular repeat protein
MVDLNTLIPTGSHWKLQDATAINVSGEIVGYGTAPDGQTHAFLLTPITTTAAAHLVFHVQPSNEIAGNPISPGVVVYIENSSNEIIITDNSSVTLKIAAGSGTLGGTFTVAAVKGIATFSNLVITKAATGYELSAGDGSDTSATSNSFNVTPAAASKLVFTTQPVGTTAGKNLSPVVAVSIEDSFGNVITTNTSKVALATKTGPGTIFGTAGVNAIAGVATFNAVNFHTIGTYTINATDMGLTSAISGSLAIKAAAAAHLVFVQNPTSVVAGVNDAPAITVKAIDAFGNIVAGASVKIAIGSGPVGGVLVGTVTTTAAATGIATFTGISFHIVGSYTLTASDGAIVTPKSTAFTVSHAAVAHLAFTQDPTNAVAGVNDAPAITVKATDAFGNIVSGASVKLAIGSGPAGGALVGTITATTAATGIATFSTVSFHIAGSYTLTASDGAIVSPKSMAFTISAAKAGKLIFTTLPVGAKHGVVFTVKVSVEDAFGNVLVADNTGTITLALATHPTGSTLVGTLTANVVKGVATFSTLKLSLAGSYSLKASDSFAIAALTSAAFAVN